MAGASADGEVNHWPAFVDVLTTVIMVVTFLLVIMSAAVMQLSQRVIANFKQQLAQQQAGKQAGTYPDTGCQPACFLLGNRGAKIEHHDHKDEQHHDRAGIHDDFQGAGEGCPQAEETHGHGQ